MRLRQVFGNLGILLRMGIAKRQVLEFPLELPQA